VHWAHNNLLKLNEFTTLFCRNSIFADLRTLHTFHFEVKLYKYVVLGWKECWGVFYRRCGFYLEGDWLWRISGGYSQEMMGMPLPRVLVFEEVIA